jgi:hypothetical protein
MTYSWNSTMRILLSCIIWYFYYIEINIILFYWSYIILFNLSHNWGRYAGCELHVHVCILSVELDSDKNKLNIINVAETDFCKQSTYYDIIL